MFVHTYTMRMDMIEPSRLFTNEGLYPFVLSVFRMGAIKGSQPFGHSAKEMAVTKFTMY